MILICSEQDDTSGCYDNTFVDPPSPKLLDDLKYEGVRLELLATLSHCMAETINSEHERRVVL